MPNGTSWTFNYSSAGDLIYVGLPTGGSISYTWGHTAACGVSAGGQVGTPAEPYVMTRTVWDGANSYTWNYNRTSPGTIVTGPDTNDTVYTHDCYYVSQTDYYQGSYSPQKTPLKTVKTTYPTYSCNSETTGANENPNDLYSGACSFINIEPTAETTILNPGSSQVVSQAVSQYDTGYGWTFYNANLDTYTNYNTILGKVVEDDQYDYGAIGSGNPGSLLRSVFTNFAWQSPSPHFSNYLAGNLLNYPVSVITKDGGGNRVAETDYSYDDFSLHGSGITLYPTNGTYRGNPTTVTRWLNGGTSPTTQTCYNDTGTKNYFFDANSVAAGHGCNTGGTPTDQYSYLTTYSQAYLTGTTDVLGHIVSAAYDWRTGVMTSFTDENTRATNYSYDSMVRLTDVLYPLEAATGVQGETKVTYTEAIPSPFVPAQMTVQNRVDGTQWKTTVTTFDGLGRETQTQSPNDPQGPVTVKKVYDNMGRLASVTNPYRSGDTIGTMYYSYDPLSRKIQVQPADSNGSSDLEKWSYNSGASVMYTDEASRMRTTTTNALGWLTQVVEVGETVSWTGVNAWSETFPSLETDYFYDALGNLYCAQQKGNTSGQTACSSSPSATNPFNNPSLNGYRGRWFVYDSLSRLTDAYNPESGHTHWTYDGNGNAITKTDANNNTITYAYDAENRVTGKTYSLQSDHPVTYAYDAASYNGVSIANPIHKHIGMTVGATSTARSYDERHRVVKETQTIGSYTKSTSTVYNVAGFATSITYPDATVLTYGYDSEGRTANIVDSAHGINYVTGPQTSCGGAGQVNGLPPVCYSAAGAVTSYVNGMDSTHPGVSVTDQYNIRLQPGTITASVPSGTLLSLTYNVNLGTGNNGNITGIVNNLDSTRTKAYRYDAYNRIIEYLTPYSSRWDVRYVIDNWGNLTNKNIQSGYNGEPLSTGGANNANQLSGFGYDSNGNLTTGDGPTNSYDSENRIISIAGVVNYAYDGDGNRVYKSTGETYWGGGAGGTLLESDGAGNPTEEYIFLNGKRIARRDVSTGSVHYYINDHIGSATIISDNQGNISEQYDYAPYGELHWNSGSDPNHYLFTGKERDSESGLDNFGARYNSSNLGRFMSPDPGNIGVYRLNPQSWNAYSNSLNNPLSLTDPTGLYVCEDSEKCDSANDKAFAKSLADAQTAANKLTGEDQAAAQRAIDAYGAQGVDNGVNVRFDSNVTGGVTEVSGVANGNKSEDNPTGQNINVTFNPNAVGGDFSGGLVGHEGSHVADASAWVASGFSPNMNPTNSTMEFNAYHVQFDLGNALLNMKAGPGGSYTGYFNVPPNGRVDWKKGDTFKVITPDLQQKIKENYQNLNSPAFTKGAVLQP